MAFKPHLISFLQQRLTGRMPKLDVFSCQGRIYKEAKLKRTVESLLSGKHAADAVVALTDVYTGTTDFSDAQDARAKMTQWVGGNPAFFAHAAQHDFEAWLLPYWIDIQRIAGHNKNAPPGQPEKVNHGCPPSYHVKEIFRLGRTRNYSKPRDANAILRDKDLAISAAACPELKAFLNTILNLCGGVPL